jgi:RNA polymerase sigma-70 factor (ECF subfamily)
MCHGALYRYARALSGDPGVAEELVQETYRRALAARNKPALASLEQVRPWLFTIQRNIWQNLVRASRREAEQELKEDSHPVPGRCSPEELLHQKFLRSEIAQAVDSLPDAYREVFVLREVEELSYAEIAAVIQSPVGTVMSRLARARQLLRRSLSAYGPEKRRVNR